MQKNAIRSSVGGQSQCQWDPESIPGFPLEFAGVIQVSEPYSPKQVQHLG